MIHTFLQRYALSRTLKNVDMIITVSKSTKKDVIKCLKFPEEKIKVIYNGVDERFKPLKNYNDVLHKYNINPPYILYIGTLEPRKNIPALIKAFYKLKKRGIRHKLVIVGKKGWKYKQIFRVVEDLNLRRDVVFTGYVSYNDLPKFYSAADLFVYPSLYEGFGLPPLEAMACGCPVITSNVSSLPEVVGDAGFIVDPSDIGGLSRTIKELLANDSLRENVIRKGLKRIKEFSWEKTAKESLKVYKEVINS
jgi:glycosyltransferase involved in cell wall biosynthesis